MSNNALVEVITPTGSRVWLPPDVAHRLVREGRCTLPTPQPATGRAAPWPGRAMYTRDCTLH